MPSRLRSFLAAFAVFSVPLTFPASLGAQSMVYWRTVIMPLHSDSRLSFASDSSAMSPNLVIFQSGYHRFDPIAGEFSSIWNGDGPSPSNYIITFLPPEVKLVTTSVLALGGTGTASPYLYTIGVARKFSITDLASGQLGQVAQPTIAPNPALALFTRPNNTPALVANNRVYSFNTLTGASTLLLNPGISVNAASLLATGSISLLSPSDSHIRTYNLQADGTYAAATGPGADFAVDPATTTFAATIWGSYYTYQSFGNLKIYNAAGTEVQSYAHGAYEKYIYNTSRPLPEGTVLGPANFTVSRDGSVFMIGEVDEAFEFVDPAAISGTVRLINADGYSGYTVPYGTNVPTLITSLTGADSFSGTEGIAALQNDTLTLTGTNTYSGTTGLREGTLIFGNAGSLSPNTSLEFVGGTLKISPGFVPASGSLRTTNAIYQYVRVDTNGQNIDLAVNAGAGSSLTKLGAGTLTVTGTYDGATTVKAGALHFTTPGSLYAGSEAKWTAANLTVESGATLALSVGGAGEFTLAQWDALRALGTATTGLKSGAYIGIDLTNAPGGALTYSGVLDDPAGVSRGLHKIGAGTLALTGANTYSGGTLLGGGTVSINNVSALGTGGLTFDGGTLTTTTGLVLSKATVLNAGGGTFAHSNGFFTLNGNVSGPGGLTKTGTSILTLSGAHTYTGATTVSGGTLKFADNGATASTLATSTLAIASGAKVIFANSQTYAGTTSGAGVLEHEFGGTTILTGAAAHTGGTNIIGGTIQVGNGGATGSLAGNVALSGNGTLAFNRSDATTFAGNVSGVGSVTQSGTGSLTLSGTNTYTGATSVNAGTLFVNGSIGGSAIMINAGGRLSGSGTVGTLTLAAGSTLAPGNSPGTLSAGSTTWAGGSSYDWEINDAANPSTSAGTSYDLLSISDANTLTITATSSSRFSINLISLLANNTVGDVINFNSAVNSSYTIASASGGIIGFDANAFTINTTGFTNNVNGGSWNLSQVGNNLNLNFSAASAIPEPSTYAAIFGALALAGAAWRKRRGPNAAPPRAHP